MARTFETNINIRAVPTEPSHAARLADLENIASSKLELMTSTEFAALESPTDSGLHPSLVGKQVVLTDLDNNVSGGSYRPPFFGGAVSDEGDMLFYLSPDGHDANNALSAAMPGKSLPVLLERLKNDQALPHYYGVYIELAVGEYDIPPGYTIPFLNRPLTISGPVSWQSFARDVILNVCRDGFNDTALSFFNGQLALQHLTLKCPQTASHTTVFKAIDATVTVEDVYLEGDPESLGLDIRYCVARVLGCGFKNCGLCVGAARSTLIYRHDDVVMDLTEGNGIFVTNVDSLITIHNYNPAIADTPLAEHLYGTTMFVRPSGVLGELPTGQITRVATSGPDASALVYRQVFTGRITVTSNQLDTTALTEPGYVASIIACGGWIQPGWGATDKCFALGQPGLLQSFQSSISLVDGQLVLYSISGTIRADDTDNAYEVWVEYTKV
jgi:hypothetical protein